MKTLSVLAVAFLVLLHAGTASATHKAWFIKNGPAECAFQNPQSTDALTNGGPITNTTSSSRVVSCPFALAGRYGSTTDGGDVFQPQRWADAMAALAYVQNGTNGTAVSCFATLQDSAGSLYFSDTRTASSGTGAKKIYLAEPVNNKGTWYGSASNQIEAHQASTARGIAFSCTLPAGASVLGHRIKICENAGDCNPASGSDTENDYDAFGQPADKQVVQTSGIECGTTVAGAVATRTPVGISAVSGSKSIFCPIAPPADNCKEHKREVKKTRVYYTNGSTSTSCLALGTCPSCRLRWWDRNGVSHDGSIFNSLDPTEGYMYQGNGTQNIDLELQVGVACEVPFGVTLVGVTSYMSTTGTCTGT